MTMTPSPSMYPEDLEDEIIPRIMKDLLVTNPP